MQDIKGDILKRIIDGEKMNTIGPNIKKARLKAGLSQKLLSDKLETMAIYICRGSISRIENSQRIITDIEIIGISEILDVSIEQLFDIK